MRRINVVGTSCSGKTTLARALAARLALEHVELDGLFWDRDWTPVPDTVFRRRVAAAASGEAWVIDGGYSPVRDLTWSRADTIVWLDFPLPLVVARWLRRTVARIRSQEEFWPGTGNRESVRNALRRGGLLWWILRTHHARRKRLTSKLSDRPDLAVVRLRSPTAAERWLKSL